MSAARGGGAGASPAKKQKIGAPATAVPVAAKDVKLLHSARAGDCAAIKAAIKAGAQVTFQDHEGGVSALMAAAEGGHVEAVQVLLQYGAPWNSVDHRGLCAGQYAFAKNHQAVVDVLVNAGVQAEMLFRAIESKKSRESKASEDNRKYLQRGVSYEKDTLVDDDKRGVMMEWETPLMAAHAEIICQTKGDVLNVGFGMGIVDGYIQGHAPRSHTIIEAHPTVYKKMMAEGWGDKPGVRVVFGRWEDVIGDLGPFDGIFFDTFDDDFMAFHSHLPRILKKEGVYSFFNGIYPENVFFQGVACQLIEQELEGYGMVSQFITCNIDIDKNKDKQKQWDGVRFKYFMGEHYYLPIITHSEAAEAAEASGSAGSEAEAGAAVGQTPSATA